MDPDRARDVVYVFTNTQMNHRFSQPEKFSKWVCEVEDEDVEIDHEQVYDIDVELCLDMDIVIELL